MVIQTSLNNRYGVPFATSAHGTQRTSQLCLTPE
nr:MAG TPA: hypothetical protein [Caudoviricetes sp.]